MNLIFMRVFFVFNLNYFQYVKNSVILDIYGEEITEVPINPKDFQGD